MAEFFKDFGRLHCRLHPDQLGELKGPIGGVWCAERGYGGGVPDGGGTAVFWEEAEGVAGAVAVQDELRERTRLVWGSS